jgi:hypothetical protein
LWAVVVGAVVDTELISTDFWKASQVSLGELAGEGLGCIVTASPLSSQLQASMHSLAPGIGVILIAPHQQSFVDRYPIEKSPHNQLLVADTYHLYAPHSHANTVIAAEQRSQPRRA